MMTAFKDIFGPGKPLIAVLHLLPLPGSPLYEGSMKGVYEQALRELDIFKRCGVQGVIVENFRDTPFYPGRVPAETVASMSTVAREVVRAAGVPVGINVLRSDAESAVAIATAAGAEFVRVNVHMSAVVSEQGIIQGVSHLSVRLRAALKSPVLIFADVGVKQTCTTSIRRSTD